MSFHGKQRGNASHASITDSDALLPRKGRGREAKLALPGPVLVENRHGLCVDVLVTQETGTAEREVALTMLRRRPRNGLGPPTLGADKAHDAADIVAGVYDAFRMTRLMRDPVVA